MGWCQNSFARPLTKFLKSTFQYVLYGNCKLKKNMLMFLRGFCRCSCLILAAACASASFLPLASPTPRFHANSITSDTKCTFPVRPEYVPSTFRWLPFLIFFVPQSWSGLPFCPSCLPLYSPLMCVHGLVSVLHRALAPSLSLKRVKECNKQLHPGTV